MQNTPANRNIKIESFPLINEALKYVADEALIQAVEIALALNKPLIISGEPGTGKTQLAHWVSAQLHQQTVRDTIPFSEKTLVFNTKSVSSASDLFYYYDAVSHFRTKDETPTEQFIELSAMGLAIVQSHGKQSKELNNITGLKGFEKLKDAPQSSIVLVDEIDKASRDFPNDLLNEMDKFEFSIRELNQTVQANKQAKVLVIMTSNSEKNLPNAFLRRCVFYHIPFPDKEKLIQIAQSRFGSTNDKDEELFLSAYNKFLEYRTMAVDKPPATSEFLDWINILRQYNLLNTGELGIYKTQEDILKYRSSLNVLFKSKDDIEKVLLRK